MTEKKEIKDKLVAKVIEAIEEKKGKNIVALNLKKIDYAVCDYFVICDAESTTQVSAIANEIEHLTQEDLMTKVWRKSGYENAQWILLDYGSVVVHVFQSESREFYKLENLWADAKFTYVN
jgi:ribosome-associated protein